MSIYYRKAKKKFNIHKLNSTNNIVENLNFKKKGIKVNSNFNMIKSLDGQGKSAIFKEENSEASITVDNERYDSSKRLDEEKKLERITNDSQQTGGMYTIQAYPMTPPTRGPLSFELCNL